MIKNSKYMLKFKVEDDYYGTILEIREVLKGYDYMWNRYNIVTVNDADDKLKANLDLFIISILKG